VIVKRNRQSVDSVKFTVLDDNAKWIKN
jgi:hypothetical protein